MMQTMNSIAASMTVLASSSDRYLPLLLILIIGSAVLSVVFRTLLKRGVNKGIDSVAQKKEMQKMQEKVERGETTEKYLRELYPDYQPNPKKPGVQDPLEALPPKPETAVPAPKAVAERPAPSPEHTDCCCICNDSLDSKFAILFQAADGDEMRADRKCYEALYDLGMSEDAAAVEEAKRYVLKKKAFVSHPELADYLEKYLRSADAYLAQVSERRGQ